MSVLAPCAIRDIDLEEGIPALEVEPGYQALRAVFWWGSIPLGCREFTVGELPIPAGALAAMVPEIIAPAAWSYLVDQGQRGQPEGRAGLEGDLHRALDLTSPLDALARRFATPAPPPRLDHVSVVICTRDRPAQLARCLRSLEVVAPHIHEIVVVDNAPEADATRRLVADTPAAIYVPETRPGLSIARNTGIRRSSGEIIAFTDDDVVVTPDWIARIADPFRDPRVMCVTGLVLPAELATEAQIVYERDLGGLGRGYRRTIFDRRFLTDPEAACAPVWNIGAGANMAIRRRAFELVGLFDERLGAGAAGCSEDTEFWYRLLINDWICQYEPAAVVFHQHRREWSELKHQMYEYMRGHVAALLLQFKKHGHRGNLRRLFVGLPSYYRQLLLSRLFYGPSPRHALLRAEIQGFIAGMSAARPRWRS